MDKKMRVGVVIIAYGHQAVLPSLIERLHAQMEKGDKLVVVDNHPDHLSAKSIRKNKHVNYVIEAENKGYSSGCNIGSAKIARDVDVFLFLNPATSPSNLLLNAIRNADYTRYAAVMPLITLPKDKINSAGNIVHMSGLSWCDAYGEPVKKVTINKDISVLSGICIAISETWWEKIHGMSESYFMYYEDTDISSRIILMGGKIELLANVTVEHDYDYKKGNYKWLYIERNRPLYILLTWPTSVIAVLSVQLFFVAIGLWIVAIIQGRFKSKAKAFLMALKAMPAVLVARKKIQSDRKLTGYEFLKTLSYKLDTPMLGSVGRNKLIEIIFYAYYQLSLFILRPLRRR